MSLALAIASMVAAALGNMSWIPAPIAGGIQTINGLLAIITKYSTAPTSSITSIVLAVLQATISTLKAIPNLNSDMIAEIQVLEDALAAAVKANAIAVQGVDPNALHPIQPLP